MTCAPIVDTPRSLRFGEHTAPLHLAPGALDRLPDVLTAVGIDAPFLVVDVELGQRYGDRLRRLLAGRRADGITVRPTEAAKTLSRVAWLADRARHADGIVAMGGGATGNLAGVLAHVLGFGRPLVQLPSTVAAVVDAAISARHGLNAAAGKNAVGVQHAPAAILADPLVLASLPPRQWREGAIEAVKAALVAAGTGAESTAQALAGLAHPVTDPDQLTGLLDMAITLKAALVARDPDESGPALALHYGHTLSQAMEKVSAYTTSHGTAVATGMRLASQVAERLGLLTPAERQQHDAWVESACASRRICVTEIARLADLMMVDPKHRHVPASGVPLVLLDGLGATHQPDASAPPITAVHREVVRAALRHLT